MATAKPSLARARARARPTRCAPPVTSAVLGIGGTGNPPVSSAPGSASPTGTALLSRSHLRAGHITRRHSGASGCRTAPGILRPPRPGRSPVGQLGRKAEIDLLEPADLVAQPGRLLKFKVCGGFAHALFEIGDDSLQIGALVMRRLALRQSEGYMIAFVNAFEDVGDAAAHAFRGNPVGCIIGLLLFAPAIGLLDRRFEAVGHPVGIKYRPAVDVASRPPDRLDQ